MRQLLYISSVHPGAAISLGEILRVSRTNNASADVTGLLLFNGKRFLQALEGADEQVASTLARIRADVRHRAIVILSDRVIEAREFGRWAMADATALVDPAATLAQVERLVATAAPRVRATFEGYARMALAA